MATDSGVTAMAVTLWWQRKCQYYRIDDTNSATKTCTSFVGKMIATNITVAKLFSNNGT